MDGSKSGQIYVAPIGIRSKEALLLLPSNRCPWQQPGGQICVAPIGIRSEEALLLPLNRCPWQPTDLASDSTLLAKIHTFNTVLFPLNINPSFENVLLCKRSVVDRRQSKAIKKMVIITTEFLLLDHVVDSTNLDRVIKSISNDAILLKFAQTDSVTNAGGVAIYISSKYKFELT